MASNYRPNPNMNNMNHNNPRSNNLNHPSNAPRGYVPGLGRGAAGFTTRSDIGPMAAKGSGPTGAGEGSTASGTGSRAAELREAKFRMKQYQQSSSQQQQQQPQTPVMFGPSATPSTNNLSQAPKGYVAGAGRGAGGASSKPSQDGPGGGAYDQFGGYEDRLFGDTPYDDEDEEADRIYQAIDDRMEGKGGGKKRKRGGTGGGDGEKGNDGGNGGGVGMERIGDQFRELKEKLADVTEEEWGAIPDVGDYSLKYKQKRREDVFTPLTDALLESRSAANADATSGSSTLAGTAIAMDNDAASNSTSNSNPGFRSVVTNMSGLAEARGTVLGMSLDKMSDSVSGSTNVDPKGYLTSLSNSKITNNADVGDVNKARLLLKSVRDTNPKHGPGWIAAARVEEAAGKTLQARKIIQEGCEACSESEDVWLEAARLHPPQIAKTILATAVRRLPSSVKLFLGAVDLENNESSKKAVLRKALEAIPTSVTLWKAAIELEEAEDAKVLLSVAVERVPQSVEMWLALSRLESYENARKVLNEARRKLPAERAVWIAAAKLEESQNHVDTVDKIVKKAVKSLAKHDAVVNRSHWLKEAETAEGAGAPLTSGAIVKHTIGMGVDAEDRQRTWADDAMSALMRGAVETSRSILAFSLAVFPSKRSLWLQAIELERKHGTAISLDEVLAAASERLPKVEIFWLVRAKEKWLSGDIDKAREILTHAFAANPDSESVWLAAAKLEWETGEVERARVLLTRARDRAGTDRVYMKSALLEREYKRFEDALQLIEEGISKYPKFDKLYMMGGQICADDLKGRLDGARDFYQRGLRCCPNSIVLWTLASNLEERASLQKQNNNGGKSTTTFTKARSLLEVARLKNPKNPHLWLQAIRLERRAQNPAMSNTLMAKALQECPNSGLLLAEHISTSPRVEQKSKSADAIKRCPDDPNVIAAVASLFASERKEAKARKWYERAVVLDADIGDSWAKYYAFEIGKGTKEQREGIMEQCVKADPKHGSVWCEVTKDMENRRKSVKEGLELVAQHILKS